MGNELTGVTYCVILKTQQIAESHSKQRRFPMGKVKLNPDAEVVKVVKEGLKAKGGYCPCRLEKKEEYKCMCEEFKAQIADPNFEGFCHCMLYYKEK
jgi:ferredoxin-thioredoxin reductase catalytic subunit